MTVIEQQKSYALKRTSEGEYRIYQGNKLIDKFWCVFRARNTFNVLVREEN